MSQPYIGEIRVFAGNFAPAGWMFCNGSVLPISENTALFALIGTTYGGDGQSTFAVPDLRGRVPVHQGAGFTIGQSGGEEVVTLTVSQIPSHTHQGRGTSDGGTATDPTNGVWASTPQLPYHVPAGPAVAMADDDVGPSGGSQPHDNMVPFVGVSFIISLFGVFPSQA